MNSFEKTCSKSHGLNWNDSDDSGTSEFDEEYYKKKPPPIPYKIIKDRIVPLDSPKFSRTGERYRSVIIGLIIE